MRPSLVCAAVAAPTVVILVHSAAVAMTLEEALRIARESSPAAMTALAQQEEARAREAGATRRVAFNPEVEVDGGTRSTPDGDSEELAVSVVQPLEIGGRRAARIAAARADMRAATAEAGQSLQEHLALVATAFLRALHAAESGRIAEIDRRVAARTLDATQRRYQSGDVALLDVNVARAELARANARVEQGRAALAAATGELRIALGQDAGSPLELEGRMSPPPIPSLEDLLERVLEQPRLEKLRAELTRVRAEYRGAAAKRWPDVGVGVGYAREESDDIVTGGLRFTVPLFDRGQGERAEALAKEHRLELELAAAARRARVAVESAYAALAAKQAALAELERTMLSLHEANEDLGERSYLAGEASLAELLLVRTQALQGRTEHLDLRLEVALAGIELLAAAGALS